MIYLIFLLLNFNFQQINPFPYKFEGITRISAIDFNVDGRTDLILWGEGRAPLLLENLGESNFLERSIPAFSDYTFGIIYLGVINYNGDKYPDILVIGNLPGVLPEVLVNDFGNRFAKNILNITPPDIVDSVLLSDVNQDDRSDIVFWGTELTTFLQKKEYIFEKDTPLRNFLIHKATLTDFDFDGQMDTLFLRDSTLILNDTILDQNITSYTVMDWNEDNTPDVCLIKNGEVFCLLNVTPNVKHLSIKTSGIEGIKIIFFHGDTASFIRTYKTARLDIYKEIDSIYAISEGDTVVLDTATNGMDFPLISSVREKDTLIDVNPRITRDGFEVQCIMRTEGFMRVTLFSRDGRLIGILDERQAEPGIYYIPYEGSHLRPGIYIIKFEEPLGIHSTRIVITR